MKKRASVNKKILIMFTLAILTIANININHTDFFIAFKTVLSNRAENRTYCFVLKVEGGSEPVMRLYVLIGDAYSLRSCSGLLGFSVPLQQLNSSLSVEKRGQPEFSSLLLAEWKEVR